jgi:hypothetical protein
VEAAEFGSDSSQSVSYASGVDKSDEVYGGRFRRLVPDNWTSPHSWPPEMRSTAGVFWPRPALWAVPTAKTAARLARQVAASQEAAWDPIVIVRALGIPVHLETLEAAEGNTEAMLLPDIDHRFVIICDPWVPPGDDERVRFRIAHELAHTLFYDWDHQYPRMTGSSGTSPSGELFCDQFAGALLSLIP